MVTISPSSRFASVVRQQNGHSQVFSRTVTATPGPNEVIVSTSLSLDREFHNFYLEPATTNSIDDIITEDGDNIVFMPADNPEALTVGALEINYGNSKKDYNGKIIKPELISLSRIEYNNGMVLEGTSTAAAFAAGAIALLSDELGMIHRVKLKSLISRGILGERIEKGVPVLKLPPPDTLSDSR